MKETIWGVIYGIILAVAAFCEWALLKTGKEADKKIKEMEREKNKKDN